jgi:hypothetical protein
MGVRVAMGQTEHQERGRNSSPSTSPMVVEVNIREKMR